MKAGRRSRSRSRSSLGAACRARAAIVVGSKKFTESVILGELADAAPRQRRRAGAPRSAARRHARAVGRARRRPHRRLSRVHGHAVPGDPALGLRSRHARARARRAAARDDAVARLLRRLRAGGAPRARGAPVALHASRIWRRIPSCGSASPRSSWRAATAGPRCARAIGFRRPTCAGSITISPGAASARGTLDVIDVYTTDAEIRYYAPALLVDDLAFFTEYQAVLVYRRTLPADARAALGRSSAPSRRAEMIAMNARAKLDKVPEARIAADFARTRFGVRVVGAPDGVARRIWRAHARAPDARRALGRRRHPRRRAARHRRRAPPPPAPAHPRHHRAHADDPVAGAARLHDPAVRHRHRPGAGGAVRLLAAADRAQHRRRPRRHRRAAARVGGGARPHAAASACVSSSCRWRCRRSSPASRPRPSSPSARRRSARSSAPAATASRS